MSTCVNIRDSSESTFGNAKSYDCLVNTFELRNGASNLNWVWSESELCGWGCVLSAAVQIPSQRPALNRL